MINQANKDRGEALFLQKIKEHKNNLDDSQQLTIDKLAAYYKNHVSIMPTESTYSAVGMAMACASLASSSVSVEDDDTLQKMALATYKESRPKSVTITATADIQDKPTDDVNYGRMGDDTGETPESLALKQAIDKEITQNSVMYGDTQYTGFAGTQHAFLGETTADVIDLVEDFSPSDLSVEGLRARKLLRADFDTMSGEIPKAEVTKELFGKVVRGTDGRIESTECPYCHESDVYMIAMDTCGCFGCGKEFKIPLEDTDEEDDSSEFIIVRG